MRTRVLAYLRQNVLALLALFIAVGTGGAYAANTIRSTDIVDGEVKSVDVGDNEIKSSDVKDKTLTTFDVSTFLGADVVDGTLTGDDIASESIGFPDIAANGVFGFNIGADSIASYHVGDETLTGDDIKNETLTGLDVKNESLGNFDILDNNLLGADIQNGTLTSADVADNTLTGADINEATLAPTAAVGIAGGPGNVTLPDDAFGKVTGRVLPAGSYAIVASANIDLALNGDTWFATNTCELRGPNGAVLGSAHDQRSQHYGFSGVSLSLNGMVVGTGGGEVGLYCKVNSSNDTSRSASGQMLIVQFDGTRPF